MASFDDGRIPCLVRGKKGLFHRWCTLAYPVQPSYMVGGHTGGQMSMVQGLIQLESGELGFFNIGDIIFPPSTFPEYDWSWAEETIRKYDWSWAEETIRKKEAAEKERLKKMVNRGRKRKENPDESV